MLQQQYKNIPLKGNKKKLCKPIASHLKHENCKNIFEQLRQNKYISIKGLVKYTLKPHLSGINQFIQNSSLWKNVYFKIKT